MARRQVLDTDTNLYAVWGHPIQHSLSPVMHNAAFQSLKLNAAYVAMDVAPTDLTQAIRGAAALGLSGINLTVPHKESALRHIDRVDAEARAIGAVNTLKRVGRSWSGTNTDGRGFLRAVYEHVSWRPRGQRVLILGAGGAARSIAVAVARGGARWVGIANRTARRGQQLVRRLRTLGPAADVQGLSLRPEVIRPALDECDLLVNATSVGLRRSDRSLIHARWMAPPLIVCDVVYNPPDTKLIAAAKRQQLRTINGLGMLLHQGALALEWWTGREAPISVMRRALTQALSSQ